MKRLQLYGRGTVPAGLDAPAAGLPSEAAAGGITPQITQILSIARRRKWLVLGAVAAALAIGLLITLLMTPKYTATTSLDIQRESGNFIAVEGAEKSGSYLDQEFYETQYGLLRARSLADHVATRLRLFDDPGFFQTFGAPEFDEWFENGRPRPGASTRQERITAVSDILLRNVTIAAQRRSRLVEISFTSPNPDLSKRVVDAWAAGFIQLTLDRRVSATAYARNFLEGRLAQLRQRIDQSERALVGYAARENIINVPGPSGPGETASAERPLVADDLAALNRELNVATGQRVLAESRLGARPGEVTEALENNAISTMRQSRALAAAEYARMMVQFERDYPPARALEGQIQQLDQAIAREEGRVRNTLRQTYAASVARENALRQEVNGLKSGLLDLRRRSIQYNIIQREVDTNRQLYDALLQRYKEIGVAGGVGINNISIVDVAEVPEKPSSPNLLLNIALSLLAGLGLGRTRRARSRVDGPGHIGTDRGRGRLGPAAAGYRSEGQSRRSARGLGGSEILDGGSLSVFADGAFLLDRPRHPEGRSQSPARGRRRARPPPLTRWPRRSPAHPAGFC